MNTITKLLFEAPTDSATARAKRKFQRSPMYNLVEETLLRRWKAQPEDARRSGKAPSLRKRQIIRSYGQDYGVQVFIETGTYLGNTVAAMKDHFRRTITVELEPTLCREAQQRFATDPRVEVLEGDSGTVLPGVLADLDEPALFWLDGHFSGGVTAHGDLDTPVWAELEAILAHRIDRHVILIDDAPDFGSGDYPAISDIEIMVKEHRPESTLTVDEGIIRITPPR